MAEGNISDINNLKDVMEGLEQMERLGVYEKKQIQDIERKRKQFELRILEYECKYKSLNECTNREEKVKYIRGYITYIRYECTLVENIKLWKTERGIRTKRYTFEYKMAKRLDNIHKRFINKCEREVGLFVNYMSIIETTGFKHRIGDIILQMLQAHGHKPETWKRASTWELKYQNNFGNARLLLLKGLHRHPNSKVLYLKLFEVELLWAKNCPDDDIKESQLKQADAVWKNGVEVTGDVDLLCDFCEVTLRHDIARGICGDIKKEIWSRNDNKDVWPYIAKMELVDHHWNEIEEFVKENSYIPEKLNICVCVYEEAMRRFPDEHLCANYMDTMITLCDTTYTPVQKSYVMKRAWKFAHEHGILSQRYYDILINMYDKQNIMSKEDIKKMIDEVSIRKPRWFTIWNGKVILSREDDNQMLTIVLESMKFLSTNEIIEMWKVLLNNITSGAIIKEIHKKVQKCGHLVFLALKPKLLNKMYEHRGLIAARNLYNELVIATPLQQELHTTMLAIEEKQPIKSYKDIKKCYESIVRTHPSDSDAWLKYIEFESQYGSVILAGDHYRSAVKVLSGNQVENFMERVVATL